MKEQSPADMNLSLAQVRNLLLIGLEPEDDPETPAGIPNGVYVCGCPWEGFFIPHFCPIHPGAFVVFEIKDPRAT